MKTHEIDGVTYVEVDRKAEVGEKILMIDTGDSGYDTGDIFDVTEAYGDYAGFLDKEDDVRKAVQHRYRVLEPLEEPTVDTTQASPAVIDLLANLARRVTSLEQQLADTQRNVERQAEEHESLKKGVATIEELTVSNTDDIAMLDDRTSEFNNTSKSGAKLLAEAFEALARYEESVSR